MSYAERIKEVLYNSFVKFMEIVFSKKILIYISVVFLLIYGYVTQQIFLTVAAAALGIEGFLDYNNGRRSLAARGLDESVPSTPVQNPPAPPSIG